MEMTNLSAEIWSMSDEMTVTALAFSVVICVLSVVVVIANAVILLVLFKSKKLRTKHFLTLGLLSINDVLLGVTSLCYESWQLSSLSSNSVKTVSSCCYHTLPLQFFLSNDLFFIAILALERTVAAFQPLFYENISSLLLPFPLIAIALCSSISITTITAIYNEGRSEKTLYCSNDDCWQESQKDVVMHLCYISVAIVVLVLNATVLFRVIQKAHSYKSRHLKNIFALKFSEQIRLLRMVSYITITLLLSQIVARSLRIMSSQSVDEQEKFFFYGLYRLLCLFCSTCNFFIYFFNSDEFRSTLKGVFCAESVVTPF
ncbi:hypothetical protein M514_00781 [Trichuris suis]|uniref:G-protein coupled receptors family 1 profile domain-containing protein n=1 Tax=Trichuris suis TaxID=68888 RepID=A0A085MMV9_9BILA|nr:hypothetical protein M513_00781 [Trichuris suis]KFD66070.1 hypothetical protein M514_00781 [Trichuris suis]